MQIDLRLEEIPPDKRESIIPTGPDFTKKGDVTLFDIHIEGESPIVRIPPYEKPKEPVVVEDDHFIDIVTNKRKIELNELDVNDTKKTLSFRINELIGKDEAMKGRNPLRDMLPELRNI